MEGIRVFYQEPYRQQWQNYIENFQKQRWIGKGTCLFQVIDAFSRVFEERCRVSKERSRLEGLE